MTDHTDVVVYVNESPEEDSNLEARLDMYFEFFSKQVGWHRLESQTKGAVLVATFDNLPPKRVKEILNHVEWGRRSALAVIKDPDQGDRHVDIWSPTPVYV